MTPRVAVLLAVLTALTVYAMTDAYRRGHHDGLRDVQATRVREVERVVVRVDSIYIRDTVRLARWRTVYDSARITDTVMRDSVVYVARDIADSTITACYRVVASCEARVAARDSLAASLRAALKAEQARRPSLTRQWAERALWLGAGVGLGAVVAR